MWTGAYVGAQVGVGRLNATATQVTPSYGYYGPCTGYYGSGSCSLEAGGAVGGVNAGYDWQNNYFVYGVMADWDATDLKRTENLAPYYGGSFTGQVDWLASIRGRMGIGLDDTLIYITGGPALGMVKSSTALVGGLGSYGSLNSAEFGWVAGFGLERKLSQQWSLKGEFLYYDLGRSHASASYPTGTYTTEFTHEIMLGQVGLEFHF
jgi:outer membrane immunogenic protein